MSTRVFETISRHQIGPLSIRLWCIAESDHPSGFVPTDVLALIAQWREQLMFDQTFRLDPREMRDALANTAGVSAVEVTDEAGAGYLAYNDWP